MKRQTKWFQQAIAGLLCLTFLSGCAATAEGQSENAIESSVLAEVEIKVPEEIPEITIMMEDGTEISYQTAKNQWNGVNTSRMPLLKGGPALSIEPFTVKGDQKISLDFGEYSPEWIRVTSMEFDYAISSGYYAEGNVKEETLEKNEDGHYQIKLPEPKIAQPDQVLASETLTLYRGYSITTKWGENICEYAFIVVIPPKVDETAPVESTASALEGASSQSATESIPATVSQPAPVSAPAGQTPQSKPPASPSSKPAESPAPAGTANQGVFSGYKVSVLDQTTPATGFGSPDWPIKTMYFYAADGTTLGSISGDAYLKIMETNQRKGADGSWEPTSGGDWIPWFAGHFNTYRGLNATTTNTTAPQTNAGTTPPSNSASAPPANSHTQPTAGTGGPVSGASSLGDLINEQRSADGLSQLSYNSTMQSIADIRAEELAQSFSHARPDGTRLSQTHSYAEIIHMGSSTAQGAYQNYYDSQAHRNIMLSTKYTSYAVGSYQAPSGDTYWVVLFAF